MGTDMVTPAGAKLCLDTCIGLQRGERVTIVADRAHRPASECFAEEAEALGAEVFEAIVPNRTIGLEDVPEQLGQALLVSDVVLVVLEPEAGCQFWHTKARERATQAGARVGLFFPPSRWDRTDEDLRSTARLTDTLTRLMQQASDAVLHTPGGTELQMSIQGREAFSCHSLIRAKGATATIPEWGDAETSPVEGSAQGHIVYDVSMAYLGKITSPIHVEVQDGLARKITGGRQATELDDLLGRAGKGARNIAELGIGTVYGAAISGHKDDKVGGTAHVALGHNVTLGGTVESEVHLDGVMLEPTLTLDGRPVLERGKVADWVRRSMAEEEL